MEILGQAMLDIPAKVLNIMKLQSSCLYRGDTSLPVEYDACLALILKFLSCNKK